jgi:hypothetical protein
MLPRESLVPSLNSRIHVIGDTATTPALLHCNEMKKREGYR